MKGFAIGGKKRGCVAIARHLGMQCDVNAMIINAATDYKCAWPVEWLRATFVGLMKNLLPPSSPQWSNIKGELFMPFYCVKNDFWSAFLPIISQAMKIILMLPSL